MSLLSSWRTCPKVNRVLADSLRRAWAVGAGPGDDQLVVDVDSFVGEVYRYDKQGAGYGYTHKRGYHPIVATRSQTGEVLHIRARKGSANTARGALRFVEELIPRVQRAGASGPKLLRADPGFWNSKITARLQAAGWTYSIGVRQPPHVKAAIAVIPEQDWQALPDYPEGGEAQIAQTMLGRQRLIVRRTRLVGAQAELWPDWRYHAFLTNRTDAIEQVEPEHRQDAVVELAIRELKEQALALPVRQISRQCRLDGDRRAGTQPAQMDHRDRATRHDHTDRQHTTPPAADRARPDHPHRSDSDTPPARPVAMGNGVLERLRTLPSLT